MNFLNPLFLAGLAAALLPVIIHLINRRKALRRPFPALDFLVKSQKKLARSLKVRQWLLLAARIAALTLLPLAMARPYLMGEGEDAQSERLPQAVVFVVDDSASMSWGDGEAWRRAQQAVAERVGELRPWDKAALVFASRQPEGSKGGEDGSIPALTDSMGDITQALDEHKPSQRATDLIGGLRAGWEILSGVEVPRERIILVTDRQRAGLDPREVPPEGFGVPIEVLDVRADAGDDAPNLAVVDATYLQKAAGPKPEFEIEAIVQNFGAQDAKGVELRLSLDGEQLGSALLDVPAGKTARKTFSHRFERKGLHRADLTLAPGTDKLAADDTFHLPIHLAQKVRVLLVNGDPRLVAYQDETFYLDRALNPGSESASAILTESVAVEGLASVKLEDFDVVMLLNVEKVPVATVGALRRFVEAGGGLLFTAGDKVEPDAYNALFGDLLPKPVRTYKRLTTRDDPDAPVKVARFGQLDHTHPIFKVFHLPGGERIQSVPVYGYVLLEPTPDAASRIIASWSDGAPALVEKRVGEGRTAFFTTTVDRDWTDFPIRTAFLPVTRRLAQHLARRGTSEGDQRWVVGQPVTPDLPEGEEDRYELQGPTGQRIVLAADSTQAQAPKRFVPTVAGHYQVSKASADPNAPPVPVEELAFAVNLDRAESDLSPISKEELGGMLAGQGADGQPRQDANGSPLVERPEKRVGVWSILLFGVTLLLLFETILGTRRSVLLRLWRLLTRQPTEPAL